VLNGVLNNAATMWFSDIPEWVTAETLGKSQLHGLTQEDYAEMWRQSATNQPMKVPTLQFLGAKDRRVPYRQGLLFDAITKTVRTPITTHVYENSSHSLADSVETSLDIALKTLRFLEDAKEDEARAK
jgi:acylaminoacyl-peptidase